MLGDISRAEKIHLACGYTDMRKAINGLAAIVQQNFKLDPFSNSLFLFCGRNCSRLKAQEEVRQISDQELRWLLEGLSIDQPKAVKKLKPKSAL